MKAGKQVPPDYHLIQRTRKSGKVVLYAGIVRADGTGRYAQMMQLRTDPATKGVRDKARRDREAHAELVELQSEGKIGISSVSLNTSVRFGTMTGQST